MEHTFKEGDRVRVIDSRPADWDRIPFWVDSMDRYAGEEGIVERSNERAVVVRFESGESWRYKPSWLKPLQARQEPLLKVGDRVRVLRDVYRFSEGQILTIEAVDSADPYFPYKAGGLWVGKEDVEPISKQPQKGNCGLSEIKRILGIGRTQEPTAKLPLINKTKLLTTIKLD